MKTCLSCKASLCQDRTKNPLKDRVLVEPCDARVLNERRCPQHDKVLECYARQMCVLRCITGSHKDHTITSLEEAFGQAQVRSCWSSGPDMDYTSKAMRACNTESCLQHRVKQFPEFQICRHRARLYLHPEILGTWSCWDLVSSR